MGKIKHELYTFGKAEVTASMGSAVDFGLAFILSDIVGIYYGLANALGVMAGGVTNCCLNYRYVFGDSNRRKRSVAWRYFIVWAISWLLNSGGTIALTEFINSHERLDIHYLIPKSVVSILVGQLSCPAQVCIQACQTEVCRRKLRHRAFTSSEVKEVDQNIQNQ